MKPPRESLIIASIRSFCYTFFGILGIAVALFLVTALLSFSSKSISAPPKTTLNIAPDAEGSREILADTSPVVLKLSIEGIIGTGDLITSNIETILLDSRESPLNDRVKAILLYINTPGGTSDDSNGIYSLLMEYKEKHKVPIYAFIDGICASGGMYIASAADKIYSRPVGLIGSIGVRLGPVFNVSKLIDKIGVESKTFTAGKDKDMLNPFRPWQPGEDASLQNILTYEYTRFIDIVTHARPRLDRESLIHTYGAQIYDPIEAQKLGYIDEGNSNYAMVLKALNEVAGIKEKYQVMELQMQHNFLQTLLQNDSLLSGKVTHELKLHPYLCPELMNKVLYLYHPNE